MANIASVLKEEIRRLAKKEVKCQITATKKAVAHYRSEIAKLRRQLNQQKREIAILKKGSQAVEVSESPSDEIENIRFSAKSVKAQRTRLGLSAANYGKLVGVSGLTIYGWEHGKVRPQKAQLKALVAIRGIGKREAQKRLAEVAPAKKK